MKISTVEFKARMGRYLDMVREGKTLYITSHRKTIARVESGEFGDELDIQPPTRPVNALAKVRGIRPASPVDPLLNLMADRGRR
jgi:antitoxin (DNA-binding transcriptional repressor) of toxin-antitoxin stability system